MTRAAAFLFLISLAGSAAGQKLTANEQAAALTGVREYARSYTASLPNYTCIQTTQQTLTAMFTALHTDVIEEQISFVDGREIRTIAKINGRPPLASDQPQIVPVSHGEFGNLLYTIFDPHSGTDIRWKRAETLDGRRVNVFGFRVPQSSGYLLVGSKGTVKAPFEGLVYADHQTGVVVQIELNCTGIPSSSEYRALNLTLDYKPAKIAGREHLLPGGFFMRYRTNRNGAMISAEFKSCRQFSADSTVRYDGDSGAAELPLAPGSVERSGDIAGKRSELVPPQGEPAVSPDFSTDPPAAASPPAPAPNTVFRASTQLVQVGVIAQDKDGKPVTDLRRDEFQIFDNGAPQEIQLFLADFSNSSAPAPQAPGTFTNRLGAGGASVLLLDKLFINAVNGEFAANVHARQKALLALKAIPQGDSIAIYALGCRFEVVHEFTADRDSLLEKLNAYHPGPAPCADGTIPENAPPADDVLAAMKSHQQMEFNALAFRREHELGEFQFQAMADHLAGIPGRKNLIWVTSQFNLSAANLKRLIDANVAIYPVDAIGVMALASPSQRKARHDQLLSFAAPSGGVVFFDRDDFEVGIQQAMRDGLVSYTLGFYPASEDANPTVHQLRVRVTRPGVTLRYRTSYDLKAPPPPSASPVADLVEALNRPVDATVIPVSADATRSGDNVDLSVAIDVSSLDLALSDGLWKGEAELVMRFETADGLPTGTVSAETLTFGFRPATYESMLKGDPYRRHSELPIPPKATELKVLVGNLASGKIGTLTIPLSQLAPSPATAK